MYLLMLISVSNEAFSQTTLDEYVQVAVEQNPGIKARFSDYMAALERVPQVGALPDPQVAFAYFIQPVETRVGPMQYRISASQMFPWFGTLSAKQDLASQQAKATFEQFQEAKSKLINEVRSTYYNLFFNHKAIQITRENLDILHVFGQLAGSKVEAGLASSLDQYRIAMEVGDLENQLARLKDQQMALQVMFGNLLNINNKEVISVSDTLVNADFTLSKQALLDTIYANNHLLKSISLQHEALEFRKTVARKAGLPNIQVGMEYTFIGKGPNNLEGTDAFVFPQIGLTIPLYRNKYKAMASEVMYQQESLEFEKEEKQNLLETMLENGWNDLRDAKRRITLFQSQLQLADKSLELLETDYANGKQSFEEILRMERKRLMYSLELEKARTDKHTAVAFLMYLTGK